MHTPLLLLARIATFSFILQLERTIHTCRLIRYKFPKEQNNYVMFDMLSTLHLIHCQNKGLQSCKREYEAENRKNIKS